jgi:hypothetical protein
VPGRIAHASGKQLDLCNSQALPAIARKRVNC